MKRFFFVGFVVSACVLPAFGQEKPPSASFPPDPRIKKVAIERSPLGGALINNGYKYIELMRDQNSGKLFVNCMANGKALCLCIDTGGQLSCISEDTAGSLKLS